MAVRKISTKLAVEGEAEYKQKIASCNTELRTLKSSLALVESEFKNNANSMEALTAKGSALSAMQNAQTEKVAKLEKALQNAQDHQEAYADGVSFAKKKVEEYTAALAELQNSTGDTAEAQSALSEEIKKWKAVQGEAESANAAATRGVQEWQRQLNNARIEQNNLSEAVKKNEQYLEEAKKSADGCATSIDKYGKEVKGAGEDSEEFGDKSKDAINQLAGALAAAGIAKSIE